MKAYSGGAKERGRHSPPHACRHGRGAPLSLKKEGGGPARDIVQRIVKEGRKFGIGTMIISQQPSEVDRAILSQCGTFIALRLSNAADRSKVQGALPDNLSGIVESLPVLRTGRSNHHGREAARLPLRCRIALPNEEHRPTE